MWPIQRFQRKHFKLYLNPEVYKAFRLLCRSKGRRRINRVIEAFMVAALHTPALLQLIYNMAEKYAPYIFHEPSKREKQMERGSKNNGRSRKAAQLGLLEDSYGRRLSETT
ncbi:MAG: hypothetical protein QXG58_07565 [Candidatus Bathyarchaeia archaeon]